MTPDFAFVAPDALFLSTGIIGSVGILGGALALGIRHGIDWDHIAAITDITSSTAGVEAGEERLVKEPALMLTDESHHTLMAASAVAVGGAGTAAIGTHWHPTPHTHPTPAPGERRCRMMFSMTTIASSTRMPIEKISAKRVMRFSV